MGRGSSKIGGIKILTSSAVSKLSDSDLGKLDKALERKLKEKNNELSRIASQNSPQNMPKIYYDTKKEQIAIMDNRRVVTDERRKRNTANTNKNKTFVNSFGEATTRTITTSSYNRQQKALSKQLMRYIGG